MKQEHLSVRRTERIFFLIVLLALSAFAVHAQDKQALAPEEALKYHLQIRTVCGKVAGSQLAMKIKGQPTLLHIGKPYPEHAFTVVIRGADRGKFDGAPEDIYRGKEVCVTGMIVEHRGKPQIVVKDPSQISVR
jgi:micrococcal nuclease